MSDQLYCPECADRWSGAYNTDHRCVTCGSPLKAEAGDGELERVRAERDALAEQLAEERRGDADLRDILDRVKEERDALAAHVEVWRKGIMLVEGWANSDAEGNQGDASEWLRHLRNWIGDHCSDDAPTTSLAPFIAQCQAAGAEEVAERAWERTDWDGLGDTPKEMAANLATLIANELRHQSQETTP